MFETDEFDVDEDFLKDIGEKEELFFSQNVTEDLEIPSKRRRIEEDCQETSLKNNVNTKSTQLSQRKNRILGLFGSSDPQTDSANTSNSSNTFSGQSKPQTSQKNVEKALKTSGKALAIEIMKNPDKNNIPSRGPQKTLQDIRSPNPKKIIQMTKSPAFEWNNRNNKNIEILRNRRSVGKISGVRSIPKALKTVMRKFPGPAGLLPDTISPSESTDTLNYLYLCDANEPNITKTSDENQITDYCTQDTKKFFSDGSWRMMIDDLPHNFLKGHDIISLKRSGANKFPLLAAVIQKIDLNVENPRVVLKDISDTVDGVMHRDVPIKFPNIMQPGVVLLLRNVGILMFKTEKLRTTRLIMITEKTLVGVYNENSRLVSTPVLETILKGEYNENELNNREKIERNHSDIKGRKTIHDIRLKNKTSSIIPLNENRTDRGEKFVNNLNQKTMMKSMKDLENKNPDDFGDIDFDFEDDFGVFDENTMDNSQMLGIPEDVNIITTEAVIEIPTSSTTSTITTSIVSEEIHENSEPNNSKDMSSGFGDLMMASDSEDEVYSQIDVDAITSSYNMET